MGEYFDYGATHAQAVIEARRRFAFAVGEAIKCPFCRVVLENRRSVVLSAWSRDWKKCRGYQALCASCWDKSGQEAARQISRYGYHAWILDGRKIWTTRTRKVNR